MEGNIENEEAVQSCGRGRSMSIARKKSTKRWSSRASWIKASSCQFVRSISNCTQCYSTNSTASLLAISRLSNPAVRFFARTEEDVLSSSCHTTSLQRKSRFLNTCFSGCYAWGIKIKKITNYVLFFFPTHEPVVRSAYVLRWHACDVYIYMCIYVSCHAIVITIYVPSSRDNNDGIGNNNNIVYWFVLHEK